MMKEEEEEVIKSLVFLNDCSGEAIVVVIMFTDVHAI